MAVVIGYIEILIIAVLCYLLLRHLRQQRNAVITNWPVFGMLPSILKNVPRIHDFASDLLKSCGGTIEIKGPWFADLDFLVTCDPVNVNHILNNNFANYPKGPEFRMMFDPLGDGIFNSDSDLWKNQRNIFQFFIGKSKLELNVEKNLHRKVVDSLIPVLDHFCRTGIQVDLQEVFHRLTFDNISLLVLGFDPICLSIEFPEVAYEKAFNEIEKIVFLRHVQPQSSWKFQRWLQIGGEKKLTKYLKVFDEFVYQCISVKREEHDLRRKRNKTEQFNYNFDMLTALIEEEEKVGQMINFSNFDKFLRDTAFSYMVAGRDTSSAGLTWFFYLVSNHPFVETKILEEMKEKLAEKKDETFRVFSGEEINKLVYLHAALCETLRLYPPVPFNHKTSIKPDILPSGHHVKGNQRVLISFYSMGRMEEIWGEDCLEFKPERWINSDRGEIVYVPSYKFTAFNAGPRICLGKDAAFIVMKKVASSILWNFRVQVVEKHPISPSDSVVLDMKHGLKVKVSKRDGGGGR